MSQNILGWTFYTFYYYGVIVDRLQSDEEGSSSWVIETEVIFLLFYGDFLSLLSALILVEGDLLGCLLVLDTGVF